MKADRKSTAGRDDGALEQHAAVDWRTGKGYPPPTASASVFAWQFLRRSSEYRADWQRYANELRALAKESAGWADFVRWRLDDSSDEYAAGSVRLRRGAWQTPLESKYADKWQLTTLIDPARSTLPDGARSWKLAAGVSYLRWSFEADQQQAMVLEQPAQLIVRVDLRVPRERLIEAITTVIDGARAELRIEAPERRNRPENWITYLRILDADETGATDDDICTALWPDLSNAYPERAATKQLSKARRAARALRDGGYLALPLLKGSSRPPRRRK